MSDGEREEYRKQSLYNCVILVFLWLFILSMVFLFRNALYPFTILIWVAVSIFHLDLLSYELTYLYYYSTETGHGKNRSIRDVNKFSLSSTDVEVLNIYFYFVILLSLGIISQLVGLGMKQSFSLEVKTVVFSIPSFSMIAIYFRQKHNVTVMKDYHK